VWLPLPMRIYAAHPLLLHILIKKFVSKEYTVICCMVQSARRQISSHTLIS